MENKNISSKYFFFGRLFKKLRKNNKSLEEQATDVKDFIPGVKPPSFGNSFSTEELSSSKDLSLVGEKESSKEKDISHGNFFSSRIKKKGNRSDTKKERIPAYLPELQDAYSLLEITHYPVTKADVTAQYYLHLSKKKSKMCMEKEKALFAAKTLILDNLDVSPFGKANETMEGIVTEKTGFLLRRKKKQWKEFMDKLEDSDVSNDPYKKNDTFKKVAAALLLCVIAVIYIGHTGPFAKKNTHLTEEECLLLLKRDGLVMDNTIFTINKNSLLDYSCSVSRILPGINFYIINHKVILNNDVGNYEVKGFSLYRNSKSVEELQNWERFYITNKVYTKTLHLSGIWKGNYIIPDGNYSMYDINLTVEQTENGFLYGSMTFLTEKGHTGKVLVEGKVDADSLTFHLNGTKWVQRPYLFQMPIIEGELSLVKMCLSNQNLAKEEFTLLKEGTPEQELPSKNFLQELLQQYTASLEIEDKRYEIPLQGMKITAITKEKMDQETIRYQFFGILVRPMFSYELSGSFQLNLNSQENCYYPQQIQITAAVQELYLEGNFTGIEYVNGKPYHAEYTLHQKSKNTYTAIVTLIKSGFPFNRQVEIREIILTDTGINSTRKDILRGEVPIAQSPAAEFDYINDGLYQKGVLELVKEDVWK